MHLDYSFSFKKIHFIGLWILILSSSCKPVLNLQDVVPTASFQGITVRQFPPNISIEQTDLKLGLSFAYRNPYGKDLPIPDHTFTFTLNGKNLPGMPLKMKGFILPAKDSIHRVYPLTIDLNPQGNLKHLQVFGKDNRLEFSSSFTVNLVEYAGSLANSFDIPVSEGKPGTELAKKYLDKKMGTRTLRLSHGQTFRLPALPQISPASRPMQVRFLGQMETLNLEPIKNSMEPMVDLLVQGYENNVLADPFFTMMDAEINVLGIGKVKVADYVMGTVLFPFFGADAGEHWQEFKDKTRPESGTPMLNHFLLTFVDPQSPVQDYWENFTDNWDTFKEMPAKIEYPGPRVTGLEIEIPFNFKNTNEFPIEAPLFFTDASLNNYHPIRFDMGLSNGSRQIPAGATREMRVKLILNWHGGQITEGIQTLIQGQELSTTLNGETMIDMGYGPMRVKMDLQGMLMKWGE